MTVVGYKCPSCGAPLPFDSLSQKMKCHYCDSTFDVDAVKAYNEELDKDNSEDTFQWKETTHEHKDESYSNNDSTFEDKDSFSSYRCTSCGGEIIADKTTSATSCPYCGNTAIIETQISGIYKPDLIIPFKLDKSLAKDIYAKFTSKKLLLPNIFKSQSTIDNIKGVYVPFWLFDCDSHGRARFEGTRVKHWSDSNYNYTKTDYYTIIREGEARFKKLPIDGSSKMPNEYMEAIEPFQYSSIVNFDKTYLSGFFAEKYDEDSQSCKPRANERIKNTTHDLLKSTVMGYNSCVTRSLTVNTSHGTFAYALLPVWLLNVRFKNQLYSFAINGQTGKVVGKLPVSAGKTLLYFLLTFILTFAIALLIIFFIL
ncbi:hypothetical protein SAMN02745248_02177 [Hathewaya proteolytica DSM 3090]|uniref:Replication restart DNA helicase PriA n=1 Tax=Hathewaya proteolytica DSM 3090 TaxID=1121331 RepID=A0A1M6R2C1_9CLOT|nr:hypothetical protein [Hathewaya proteolytica]SHK26546.1 hypothetical protein SAMN02745248_02177 [Hathewaya proteolytica DSM 3090]